MLGAARKDPPLAVQFRVIKALLLRDIRTRFFGNGLGYVIAILWPLVHIIGILAVYTFTGRVAPVGDSTLQFLAVGVVPVICFMYMSRGGMQSVMLNRPLLNFPVVTFLDIILSRTILEVASAFLVAAVMFFILFAMDVSIIPRDPSQAALAFLFVLFFGAGFGAINGVIVFKVPMWMIVSILFNMLIYFTSGVIFLPSALPEEAHVFITWNPVMHAVEWIRESYYVDYKSVVLNKQYLMSSGPILLFLGFGAERALRKFLMR